MLQDKYIEMRINIIVLIILILFLLGCTKENNCPKNTSINGEWIWVKTGGSRAGPITPESTGISRKLVIDDFIYREFENDSLVLETQYELGISDEELYGTKERTFIEFASGGYRRAIIISETKLELISQCFDCPYDEYKRN